jgi:hypothetical protein
MYLTLRCTIGGEQEDRTNNFQAAFGNVGVGAAPPLGRYPTQLGTDGDQGEVTGTRPRKSTRKSTVDPKVLGLL